MKKQLYISFLLVIIIGLGACEKKSYQMGLPEYENHYYAAYIPNNNSTVSVQRSQSSPVKLAVQFYSAYSRNYDAVAYFAISTNNISNPAILGEDFQIVDAAGNTIQPENGKYSIVFPHAERAMDTIYVKLLNNPAPGTRKMEVQILENQTDQYYVDIFSTAYRRPIEIK